MFKIERRFGGTYDTYPVYTVDEADAQGLDYYDDWSQCDEGEWGRTDDDYVMRCHSIYELEKSRGVTLQLCFTAGSPFVRLDENMEIEHKQEFAFLLFLRTGGYNHARPQTWQEAEARKTRTKRAIQFWANLFIMNDGDLGDREWFLIGKKYRDDDANREPAKTARRLFQIDEVQIKAMKELARQVHEAGETPEEVIDKYNELFEETVDGDEADKQIALDTLRDLRDMAGMDPDRRPEPGTDEGGGGLLSMATEAEQHEQEMGKIEEADAEVLPESTEE